MLTCVRVCVVRGAVNLCESYVMNDILVGLIVLLSSEMDLKIIAYSSGLSSVFFLAQEHKPIRV